MAPNTAYPHLELCPAEKGRTQPPEPSLFPYVPFEPGFSPGWVILGSSQGGCALQTRDGEEEAAFLPAGSAVSVRHLSLCRVCAMALPGQHRFRVASSWHGDKGESSEMASLTPSG